MIAYRAENAGSEVDLYVNDVSKKAVEYFSSYRITSLLFNLIKITTFSFSSTGSNYLMIISNTTAKSALSSLVNCCYLSATI